MADKVGIKNIDVDRRQYLRITDLENMFNIYTDNRGYYIFNLNETIYFNKYASGLPMAVCQYDQYWTTLSYNIYGTTRLAWLLMKVNGVTTDNVFDRLAAGDKVRYVPQAMIQDIVNNIND